MPDLVPGHLLTKLAHQVANGAGALDEKPQHNFTYSCWSFIGLPFLLHHDDCADDVCLRALAVAETQARTHAHVRGVGTKSR